MSQEEKPRLIIDEDWKTQVERERAALKDPDTVGQPDNQVQAGSSSGADRGQQSPPLPPASFPFLVSMLGTQALAALGQLPAEEGGSSPPHLAHAKHFIDLLDILERKTKGNLETAEYDLLADWLHQLRMTYVSVSKRT